jgi:Bacterial Ig domain/Cadherin-like
MTPKWQRLTLQKVLKNNWVWLSIVTVPIVAVLVGLIAFDFMSRDVVTANNRSSSIPQELVKPMPKNPALVASQETPVDRLFRFGAYVSFRSSFGDQKGWIHGFSFHKPYQDWIYDIHTAEGIVFNDVFQVHVIREEIPPGPNPGFDPDNVSDLFCHPSYEGECLDVDYDCIGSGDDGPLYTPQVLVVGPDLFKLDLDEDGIGCEGAVRPPAPKPTPEPPAPTPTPKPPTPEPPANDPATAADLNSTVQAGEQVAITLQGEDNETCNLDFTIRSSTDNGTLSPISNQSCSGGTPNVDTAVVVYIHDGSETTSDSFTYRVCDDATPPGCDTGTVRITITPPPNTEPTGANVNVAVNQGGEVSIPLLGSDAETCELTFTTTETSSGTLSSITDQSCQSGSPNTDSALVTYTHDGSDTTSDEFTYRVCDDAISPLCATETVVITVIPPEDPTDPVTGSDTVEMWDYEIP